MVIKRYLAGYRDNKSGKAKHIEIESGASYTQRRKEFEGECKRNGWTVLYFEMKGFKR